MASKTHSMPFVRRRLAAGLCLFSLFFGSAACWAVDYVTVRREGKTSQVEGRIVLTALDGGILLEGRDGVLWNILPEEQAKKTRDERAFRPLTGQELGRALLAELPAGFEVHQTTHYVILHDTSRAYAQWCGSLFERLYGAFTNYWSRRGFELHDPEFPLVAVVFADKRSYAKFAQAELGSAASSIIGYYSLATNRMTMYDLTGTETAGRGRGGASSQINQILAAPDAQRTVSTIVHEATHQIAFNCGLHTRYSDCPLWFSEGIAIYFETPDLHSAKGWSGVGTVNRPRLAQFQKFLSQRPRDSLKKLVENDKRFRDLNQALDAYAEAWGLTYFLLKQRPKQYLDYLKILSEKKPLVEEGPAKRLQEFEQCFGDIKKLDGEFVRYMNRLR